MAPNPLPNSVQILCSSQKAFCDLRVSFHCLTTACVLILVLCFPSVPKMFQAPRCTEPSEFSFISGHTVLSDKCLPLIDFWYIQDAAQRVENQEVQFWTCQVYNTYEKSKWKCHAWSSEERSELGMWVLGGSSIERVFKAERLDEINCEMSPEKKGFRWAGCTDQHLHMAVVISLKLGPLSLGQTGQIPRAQPSVTRSAHSKRCTLSSERSKQLQRGRERNQQLLAVTLEG